MIKRTVSAAVTRSTAIHDESAMFTRGIATSAPFIIQTACNRCGANIATRNILNSLRSWHARAFASAVTGTAHAVCPYYKMLKVSMHATRLTDAKSESKVKGRRPLQSAPSSLSASSPSPLSKQQSASAIAAPATISAELAAAALWRTLIPYGKHKTWAVFKHGTVSLDFDMLAHSMSQTAPVPVKDPAREDHEEEEEDDDDGDAEDPFAIETMSKQALMALQHAAPTCTGNVSAH